MERTKTQQQDEEKLPFTPKMETIDDEFVKKTWNRIRSVVSDRQATANDKVGDHKNKNSDLPCD